MRIVDKSIDEKIKEKNDRVEKRSRGKVAFWVFLIIAVILSIAAMCFWQ